LEYAVAEDSKTLMESLLSATLICTCERADEGNGLEEKNKNTTLEKI
jgi:hypothetical protein